MSLPLSFIPFVDCFPILSSPNMLCCCLLIQCSLISLLLQCPRSFHYLTMGITTTTTTTTRTMKIAAVVAVAVDDNVFFDPVVSQLRHSTNRELVRCLHFTTICNNVANNYDWFDPMHLYTLLI